jgi:hypothetical protein
VPEILTALHLIPDPASAKFTVLTTTGMEENVEISPLAAGTQSDRVGDFRTSVPRSDLEVSTARNFQISYLPATKTLVLRIKVIQDSQKDVSVAQVAQRLNSISKGKQLSRFVIDLRDCHGGDNQKFRAVLLEILRNATSKRSRPEDVVRIFLRGFAG